MTPNLLTKDESLPQISRGFLAELKQDRNTILKKGKRCLKQQFKTNLLFLSA